MPVRWQLQQAAPDRPRRSCAAASTSIRPVSLSAASSPISWPACGSSKAPVRYVVTERYQVDKDELPIEQIFVADGPPGLTLITCGGVFDGGARSYEDNIVVRAVPA